jgi:hypothetical protein
LDLDTTSRSDEDLIEKLAKLAEKRQNSGVVTIGNFSVNDVRSYEQQGFRYGNLTYYLGGDAWTEIVQKLKNTGMSPTEINLEMWRIEKKFLDNQIAQDKEFQFTDNPNSLKEKTFAFQDKEYLLENGYRFENRDGNWWAIK